MKNKRFLSTTLCLLIAVSLFAQKQEDNVRIKQLFNFDWKFRYGDDSGGDVKFYAPAYTDNDWRKLDLPHDFQFEQPWDRSAGGARGFKAMGEGWYRKTFKADPVWKGKRVLLDFEGIMLVGDVWFNGEKVGGTDYGYLGFEADITRYIRYEEDNVIAVYASTGKTGNSRWYTGGGLFRDVHLVVKDTITVARHGVYITTPSISEKAAEINVQVELEGLRGKRLPVQIEAKIFSPDGQQVATARQTVAKRVRKLTEEVLLPAVTIENPRLWSCETPDIYTAEITLTLDGKTLDRVHETFGIRTLEYSKDFGFKLNGKKLILKGIANHHDLGAVGVAAYESAIERQFKVLKEFGFNHIRTSHNPYSESFLRLADKHGILVTDELFDKWSTQFAGGRKSWQELWKDAIPEWIKRDRNHPSVVMWSLGNELQTREEWTGIPAGDWGVTAYRILDVLVKRYDPTRKTTVAMFPARVDAIGKNEPEFNTMLIPPELSTVTDIASYNYRYNSYAEYIKHFPHLIVYQSEATTNELAKPYFGMDLDKVVGLAYWGGIEYWGESHGWPRKGWNYSFFNHALEPYPQAYLIKSIFCDEPIVHIGIIEDSSDTLEWNDIVVGTMPMSDHWNRESGSKQNIFTFTNADEVELLVNGKSFGIRKNDTDLERRNMIYWQNVPYQAGKITAIARTNGKEVAVHQIETTGKAVALRMDAENPDWKANGMDLQYVKVYAVDNKGRKVPLSDGEVTFNVSGAAQLIAVDNGDHESDELFAGNKRKLHNGFAMAILRAGQTGGEVKIKAEVRGLKSAEKVLATGKK